MSVGGHESPDWPDGALRAVPWHRSACLEDGRLLRIVWVSGYQPLERVDIDEADDHITVTLLERHPPGVLPDGTETGVAAVALTRCVEVRLASAIGRRLVLDGSTGEAPDDLQPGEYGDAADRAMALEVDLVNATCEPRPSGELLRWDDTLSPPASGSPEGATSNVRDRLVARFFSDEQSRH